MLLKKIAFVFVVALMAFTLDVLIHAQTAPSGTTAQTYTLSTSQHDYLQKKGDALRAAVTAYQAAKQQADAAQKAARDAVADLNSSVALVAEQNGWPADLSYDYKNIAYSARPKPTPPTLPADVKPGK